MKVLCISESDDAHLPFVQKHLDEEIVIFDPGKFPFKTDISYKWNACRFDVFSDGRLLSDCDAVWYRKPQMLEPKDLPVDEMYREYAFSAYQKTIQALYSLLQDKIWVSDYWSIIRGSNKLLQAEIAHKLGLCVPRTLVTSVAIEAEAFIRREGQVVVKMMGTHHVYDGEASHVFYTAPVGVEDIPNLNLEGLPVAPSIFQQRIEKAYDIRLTVVGDQAFPCSIKQRGLYANDVDWRTGIFDADALVYEPCEMPTCIIESCKLMLRLMNLRYGAFDFVVDPSGNYWFVEVNPNGQWAFVEEEAGIEISRAFPQVFAGN
jgi:glutathione synthase/RimK-type ligase-like ATP-grasp enzyme